jgi:hypothetical protein
MQEKRFILGNDGIVAATKATIFVREIVAGSDECLYFRLF